MDRYVEQTSIKCRAGRGKLFECAFGILNGFEGTRGRTIPTAVFAEMIRLSFKHFLEEESRGKARCYFANCRQLYYESRERINRSRDSKL